MLEAVSLDELGFQSLIVGESEAVATVGQETNLRKKQLKTLNMQNSSRSVKSIHFTKSIKKISCKRYKNLITNTIFQLLQLIERQPTSLSERLIGLSCAMQSSIYEIVSRLAPPLT